MKRKLALLFFGVYYLAANVWADPTLIDKSAPVFTFCMPEMAGQLTFGIIKGEDSKWITDTKIKIKEKKGTFIYIISDPLLGKGRIEFRVVRLTDSDGVILEVEAEGIDNDVELLWSYAGASGKMLTPPQAVNVQPDYCTYNVYSVEHTAFTLYYGESMNLKVIQAVMPLTSAIRLSNYHVLSTPLLHYRSGKKTEAPSLAGVLPVRNGQKEYVCIYRQNDKADYNYYMLPALFEKEFVK